MSTSLQNLHLTRVRNKRWTERHFPMARLKYWIRQFHRPLIGSRFQARRDTIPSWHSIAKVKFCDPLSRPAMQMQQSSRLGRLQQWLCKWPGQVCYLLLWRYLERKRWQHWYPRIVGKAWERGKWWEPWNLIEH